MEPLIDDRSRIRNYLLGVPELTGSEAFEDLEQRLLTDNEFLSKFSLVKDELMEDYVTGALSDDETLQFEKHFLSTPGRVLQVEIVRSLVEKPAVYASSWTKYLPIAAVIAVAALAGLLVWVATRSEQQPMTAALERLNDPRTSSPPHAITSLTLKQIYVRGAEDRRVVLSEGKTIILLQLELLGDAHQTYRASLQSGEGAKLGVVQNLKPDAQSGIRLLNVKLPADQLTPGSYQIKLDGVNLSGQYEAAGLYPFQVVKP